MAAQAMQKKELEGDSLMKDGQKLSA